MSTSPYCSRTKKQLANLQKECKFWKEKYFIEKKKLNCLIQWILGVFGFNVQIEFDKTSLGLRIEGRENKDAIKQAVFPTSFTDNKTTFLLEDRIESQDFLEEPDEILALSEAEELSHGNGDDDNVKHVEITEDGSIVDVGVTNDSDTNQVILDMFRNYKDSTGQQQQPSYIYLKDGNNQETIQLDCSQFLNISSDNNNQQQHQIVYRIASPNTSILNANANTTQERTTTTTSILAPTTKKTTSTPDKGKRYSPPQKKTKATVPILAAVVNDEIKIGDKISSEFGLTMREKAEVYVQTQAMKAIIPVAGGGYACSKCKLEYTFNSREKAAIHTKTHFSSLPYKCQYCNNETFFRTQKELLEHRKQHFTKSNFKIAHVMKSLRSTTKSSLLLSSSSSSLAVPTTTNKQQTISLSPRNSNTIPVSTTPTKINSEGNIQSQPGPVNRNKQFKCKILGCEWSYATANELSWHAKAHIQKRV